MIVHVLRFAFEEGATGAVREHVLVMMRRTASAVSVASATVGRGLGEEGGGVHAYCVGIAGLDALRRYMHDPLHVAGDPQVAPRPAGIAFGPDLFDDVAADLAARILALHEDKAALHPHGAAGLAALLTA
ncbi:Dabb family protein [Kitasatospora aureofaciens]|uniref:Dabb family protein n=1 Tax=Kitasatospora aureofaciens TaxID=1894 RepID=UPI000525F74C|nr:Dabb family protein [Kitasatospora aureofaciens]